ncbi:MAG TPA: carboxypeptidase regulatory-like domain-containing protein [Gemmatimonadales bacterium]|nr:carboxypeptidase regulatory-like domain-containing protein [Gemmatimonadales bacterium]
MVDPDSARREALAGCMQSRASAIALLFLLSFIPLGSSATAQGLTTGGVRGSVRSPDGRGLDGAAVRVVNTASGFSVRAQVVDGRFLVQGLEPGGPYVVEVRRIGFLPQQSPPLRLRLGEQLSIAFVLQPAAIQLEPIEVHSSVPTPSGSSGTTVSEAMVQRLPTLNRNFQDFVTLAPYVSTKVGDGRTGVSGAGANLRFNSFLVNGASERFVNGSVSAASNVGKSIPLDAVKEYQVLVAPYDVRYGSFAGVLVNTVTQSGTNDFRGSAFGYWRNDRLARDGIDAVPSPYDRLQLGFSLGGPIVEDRVHFFVASEIQRLSRPASGPYLGQPPGQLPQVPVREADLTRLQSIMQDGYGLTPGSARYMENGTPLVNLFARMDAAIPAWNSRVMAFATSARIRDQRFSRASTDTFALSSYRLAIEGGVDVAALQLHTDLKRERGGHNELLASLSWDHTDQVPEVRQPLVRVLLPGTRGGSVLAVAGSAQPAQGRFGRGRAFTIRDELSLPWARNHLLVAGVQLERFRVLRGGVPGGYGTWTFGSLDAFEAGTPIRFELRKDFGSESRPLRGGQYTAYLGDEWLPAERLAITTGVRAELLTIDGTAPYNPAIDSLFGRRTDLMPRRRVELSPRLGVTWDLSAVRHERVRGGIGLFTGRPPLAWYVPALANHGEGIGVLTCGFQPSDAGLPPAFVPDYEAAPDRCATGAPLAARPFGDVDLLDPGLRMARTLRTSLGYERELPGGLLASAELLVSRQLSDFMWVNLNLRGPQAVDRFGRVLYGTIDANGVAAPALRSGYAEVIDLQNTARNYSYQLAGRVERRFADGIGASVAYTYSRTRDVQSPSRVNTTGIRMWADARTVSGRHDDSTLGISLNDLPHRIVAALTWTAPWRRWPTRFAFFYVGESGSPFTYVATGTSRRGDLNADGSNANDPIYVPRSAFDTSEIRFESFTREESGAVETVSEAQQAAAFDRFLEEAPCLRRQRGRIVARNSCREPWTHTTIASVRQDIPIGRQVLELELDAFNLLNLLSDGWGRYQVARPGILDHVGQGTDSEGGSQPIFRFDPAFARWETLPAESAFQLQVAARYRF